MSPYSTMYGPPTTPSILELVSGFTYNYSKLEFLVIVSSLLREGRRPEASTIRHACGQPYSPLTPDEIQWRREVYLEKGLSGEEHLDRGSPYSLLWLVTQKHIQIGDIDESESLGLPSKD